MKKVIIINGTGGSGKDTFVELCTKYEKVENISSIDFIKNIATIGGWEGDKSEKSRKFLSDLKKVFTEFNNAPLKDILDKTKKFLHGENNVLFIHIREAEEIEKAKIELETMGISVETLLIKRAGLKNIETNKSDALVDNYDYDRVIFNDTLDGLEKSSENLMLEIKNQKILEKKN